MTTSIWFRSRWLLRLWILLVATILIPPAIFAYDASNQATTAFDEHGESAIDYGAVSGFIKGEQKTVPSTEVQRVIGRP